MQTEAVYYELLRDWCDALIGLQITGTGRKEFDGGLMCPSCAMIHGRCPDAVYPLMYMADRTGEDRYLAAALALFDWGENMMCDDGSLYNDAHSKWNGITVFAAIGLCEALEHHGHLLSAEAREKWVARLTQMGEWLYRELTMQLVTNINYHATCSAAMAMLGRYFGRGEYSARAREMAHACMGFIGESGLFTGEGHPADEVTARGCRPVDIGYNVEESLPALLRYARIAQDDEVMRQVLHALWAHLDLMLPDGAWDNSFGTRNFKWTYWGSRTSDGCQLAYAVLGGEIPEFGEAALRNVELYRACTHDGLLHGGPHYHLHGEKPCVHHTFCHAKALATALDSGLKPASRTAIPSEGPSPIRYYPEIDTYRLAAGGYRATVTGYDLHYMSGGHASGGAMTLLWHEKTGPLLLTGMTDYSLHEPHNMQLSTRKAVHRSLAPRVEMQENGVLYAQCYDYRSDIHVEEAGEGIRVNVTAALVSSDQQPAPRRVGCQITYLITSEGVDIHGQVSPAGIGRARFVLPVIAGSDEPTTALGSGLAIDKSGARVTVSTSRLAGKPERIFNLCGGFEAHELIVLPDEGGRFNVRFETK